MEMWGWTPWDILPGEVPGLKIPNLKKLGMVNLHPLEGMEPAEHPLGRYMRLKERSRGKDTMTGHWEMMGLLVTTPFQTFTSHGFPKELIDELEKRTGRKIIGNKSASGTETWMNWRRRRFGKAI